MIQGNSQFSIHGINGNTANFPRYSEFGNWLGMVIAFLLIHLRIMILNRMKNRKCPSEDHITKEMFKSDGNSVFSSTKILVNK